MYSLRRERDGAGDSGGMSTIFWVENGLIRYENFAKPRVGASIRVGATYARSYAAHEYWQTTLVTEILEATENRIRFKTENSVYVWEIV